MARLLHAARSFRCGEIRLRIPVLRQAANGIEKVGFCAHHQPEALSDVYTHKSPARQPGVQLAPAGPSRLRLVVEVFGNAARYSAALRSISSQKSLSIATRSRRATANSLTSFRGD